MDISERAREFAVLVMRNDGAADHIEVAEVLGDAANEIERLRNDISAVIRIATQIKLKNS